MQENKKPKAFSEINNSIELVHYLQYYGGIRENKNYLHHYTSLASAISIFKNKTWHLSQAYCMNDKLEYYNGNMKLWNNIFFSSFMREDDESIGMWSMYGQSWDKGVKISIPKSAILDWINSNELKVTKVNCRKKVNTDIEINTYGQKPFLTAVAYCNTDRIKSDNNNEEVYYGTVKNFKLTNISHNPDLTGYIKDLAWSYEKEVRLRLDINNVHNYKRIALSLPPDLLDSIVLTPSPLFIGDFVTEMKKEIERQYTVKESLFKNKFQLKADCNSCKAIG